VNNVCISTRNTPGRQNTGRPLHFKKYRDMNPMSTHGSTPIQTAIHHWFLPNLLPS